MGLRRRGRRCASSHLLNSRLRGYASSRPAPCGYASSKSASCGHGSLRRSVAPAVPQSAASVRGAHVVACAAARNVPAQRPDTTATRVAAVRLWRCAMHAAARATRSIVQFVHCELVVGSLLTQSGLSQNPGVQSETLIGRAPPSTSRQSQRASTCPWSARHTRVAPGNAKSEGRSRELSESGVLLIQSKAR